MKLLKSRLNLQYSWDHLFDIRYLLIWYTGVICASNESVTWSTFYDLFFTFLFYIWCYSGVIYVTNHVQCDLICWKWFFRVVLVVLLILFCTILPCTTVLPTPPTLLRYWVLIICLPVSAIHPIFFVHPPQNFLIAYNQVWSSCVIPHCWKHDNTSLFFQTVSQKLLCCCSSINLSL